MWVTLFNQAGAFVTVDRGFKKTDCTDPILSLTVSHIVLFHRFQKVCIFQVCWRLRAELIVCMVICRTKDMKIPTWMTTTPADEWCASDELWMMLFISYNVLGCLAWVMCFINKICRDCNANMKTHGFRAQVVMCLTNILNSFYSIIWKEQQDQAILAPQKNPCSPPSTLQVLYWLAYLQHSIPFPARVFIIKCLQTQVCVL